MGWDALNAPRNFYVRLVGLRRGGNAFFNESARFLEVIVQGVDDRVHGLKEVLGSEELDVEAGVRGDIDRQFPKRGAQQADRFGTASDLAQVGEDIRVVPVSR